MKVVNIKDIDLSAIQDSKLEAILICLFTNARVDNLELPLPDSVNQGYWADDYEMNIAGKKTKLSLGSKIWLLLLGKLDGNAIKLLEQYVLEALAILINAGEISTPVVSATRANDVANLLLIFENETISLEGFE